MDIKIYCQKCKKLGQIGHGFYLNSIKRNKSGEKEYRQYICRECNSERVKLYRATDIGKQKTRNAVYKSIKKYSYKQKARNVLYRKVKNGSLIKPNSCEKCGKNKRVEGHHFKGYRHPLIVMWLCRSCHCYEERNKV